jgi:hypothetical protein
LVESNVRERLQRATTRRGWTIPTSFLLGCGFWLRRDTIAGHCVGVLRVGLPSLGRSPNQQRHSPQIEPPLTNTNL